MMRSRISLAITLNIRESDADNGIPPSVNCSIETLEGVMKANVGDYIIKGVNGEFYPCKQDIFEKTYLHEDDMGNVSDGYHTLVPTTIWLSISSINSMISSLIS